MDLTVACEILGLNRPFSLRDLKRAYYKAALNHHPDRNMGVADAKERFQTVRSAYDFLTVYMEIEDEEPEDSSYMGLLHQFIQVMSGAPKADVSRVIEEVVSGCQRFSVKAFENIDKHTALRMFGYIDEYSEILGLTKESLGTIREIMKQKMAHDELYILNPTLDNLFNKDVYKLGYDDRTYYVPLWHDELQYDESGNSVIVKCIPDLADHIHIDTGNNIHVNVSVRIAELLSKRTVDISLGSRNFEVPVQDLRVRKLQSYTFRKRGIPSINTREIYNVDRSADVVVHIDLIS
jgi:hypothetical protein